MAVDERPLRRDAERNRRRILKAAATVFAARGLDVSLDEIARCAGVGVATVYRRFANREELIEALFEDRLAEVLAAAEGALASEDAWAGLVAFLERVGAVHAADRGMSQLLLGTAHGQARLNELRAQLKPLIDEVVARAWRAGALRPDVDGRDLAGISVMLAAIAEFTRDVDPEHWRRHLAIVLDGLRTRRDGPAPLPRPPLDDEQLERAMTCWRPSAR